MLEHRAAALGAVAQAFLRREVDDLAGVLVLAIVAEVEFQLPLGFFLIELERQLGHKGPARLGAEAFERADLLVAQELVSLVRLKRAATG